MTELHPIIKKGISEVINHLKSISFEDSRVLVTGGSGFLGSWICDVLIQKGAHVQCLDNYASGRKVNTDHLLAHDNFSRVECDISSSPVIEKPVDLVLHLASRASPLEFDQFPIQILKSNTLGTMNALGIAKKFNARFMFTSTSETYGEATVFPTPESYRGNVNTLGIRGCYDEAKRAGEAFCMAYHRQHNLDVRIARIFNTYGPRMRTDGFYGRVIPRFIAQATRNNPITIFGDGNQTRSFCYVTDQVTGLLRLAGLDNISGSVINIGNPQEITIKQLANEIIKLTESASEFSYEPLPPDDPSRRVPEVSRAREILGWNPTIDLEDGLDWMIQTMKGM